MLKLVKAHRLDDCIRCGFCEAVCPTYTVNKDRLHGPRGRVLYIVAVAEGKVGIDDAGVKGIMTCLLCYACNQVCPAGIDIVGGIRDFRVFINNGPTQPRRQR